MNLLSLLSLAGLIVVCQAARIEPAPFTDAYIDHINSIEGITWKAGRNFDLKDMPYVRRLLGLDFEANKRYNRLHVPVREVEPRSDLPTHFDGREKWPNCDSVREIRDQSACGSCWAFGSSEAISDRICVATGKNVHISALDILSCCDFCSSKGGCNGGNLAEAWKFFVLDGVVTGGNYNSSEGCLPYPMQKCTHVEPGPEISCSELHYTTPECPWSCIKGYPNTYFGDKVYGRTYYRIEGVENIMTEILTTGSVSAGFRVYGDFWHYKSGVYKHVFGKKGGGHVVKILGWGVEDGVDYWLVANSWNESWGDKGFFKIQKGVDECGIESVVVAGLPK